MNIQANKLKNLIDRLLSQQGKTRRGDTQICYFCPWCHHIKRKLEIAVDGPDLGSYHCWVCNKSGKSLKSLFFKLRAPKQYLEELFSIVGYGYKEQKVTTEEEIRILPSEFKPLNKTIDSYEFESAWYYLAKRGVTKNDVLRYNIGYCDRGEYERRIIVPSYDKDGNLNFFSARDYTEQSRFKYMLSPWSKDIIGFEVFINWDEPVTIVESPFNSITIRNNSIPLFGKTISNTLRMRLIETNVSVNVCLDKDAEKNSIDLCEELLKLGLTNVKFVKLTKKDPNEIGFIEMNQLIKNAKRADFSFIIKEKMRINCK